MSHTSSEDRAAIARAAATALRAFAPRLAQTHALVGFDGFVDAIIRVVDKRHDLERYEAIPTLKAFGKRIAAADGRSANAELVVQQEKLGGNGPIMANAMLRTGFPVTYVGALGRPEVHPVFAEFAQRAEVHSVADPGFTDALEFETGKLMLGKYAQMASLDADTVVEAIGRDVFASLVRRSKLIGMTNWTMLPRCESVWKLVGELIEDDLLPDERPIVFVDFADPAKRTAEDLGRALGLLADLQQKANVVLGMNLSESGQVREVLGLPALDEDIAPGVIETTACEIRESLNLHGAVVHPRAAAAAAVMTDAGVASARFAGPYVKQPKISTGAGDNFNGGFCLGLLAGLTVEQALCAATATSGYYVRNAQSPTLDELASFCDTLPAPMV